MPRDVNYKEELPLFLKQGDAEVSINVSANHLLEIDSSDFPVPVYFWKEFYLKVALKYSWTMSKEHEGTECP